jgi:hypothetical protein
MKKIIWMAWGLASLGLLSWLLYTLGVSEDKSTFVIGEASYGHYQIEMACTSCHTEAFGGTEVLQNACTNCHAEELEEAHDSHPMKKFTDPREAYRLEILDARYCMTCHKEHQHEQTRPMGVTLPDDYCYHCHTEVGEERESHKDLPFDSCASAGCHNFHDNRALYESFLVSNANQPWLKEIGHIQAPNHAFLQGRKNPSQGNSAPTAIQMAEHPDIVTQWGASDHADAGVTCVACHQPDSTKLWIEKPSVSECQSCQNEEAAGFLAGKHGMRLAQKVAANLSAITPEQSHLAFKETAMNIQHG